MSDSDILTAATAIPSASDVNYSDLSEICGYSVLVGKILEKAGGLDYPTVTNKTVVAIQREGFVWLREVKRIIAGILTAPISSHDKDFSSNSDITLGSIPLLLASYDFVYRACNGKPCFSYLREIRLKTADRWLKGDNSISQTDVVLMLRKEVDRDIHTLGSRYIDYSSSVMDLWINELETYGELRNVSAREAYDIVTFLINQDLFIFLGNQDYVKRGWIKAYTLPKHEIDALDTNTLWAYIGFAQAAALFKRLTLKDIYAEKAYMLSILASRPDLHPYYREAIRLGIENRQRLFAVCYSEETA